MREYNKGISVIIPNYNGLELFPQTIPTIFEALAEIKLENEYVAQFINPVEKYIASLTKTEAKRPYTEEVLKNSFKYSFLSSPLPIITKSILFNLCINLLKHLIANI